MEHLIVTRKCFIFLQCFRQQTITEALIGACVEEGVNICYHTHSYQQLHTQSFNISLYLFTSLGMFEYQPVTYKAMSLGHMPHNQEPHRVTHESQPFTPQIRLLMPLQQMIIEKHCGKWSINFAHNQQMLHGLHLPQCFLKPFKIGASFFLDNHSS